MSTTPGLLIAFGAGFLSFISPCCLPLVPGYLAAVTGTEHQPVERKVDLFVIRRSLIFVGTFASIFILYGLSATAAGTFLTDNAALLNKIAGAAIIAMGLIFMASPFVLSLNKQWRPSSLIERAGDGGPAIAGAAFAIAWTPCMGPTLGAILSLAATQERLAQGALLLAVYSAGLAVPFLMSAIAFSNATNSFSFFKRHYTAIQLGSGAVLVAMGVLVITGELFRMSIAAQAFLQKTGLDWIAGI
ncbi:MAG: cytochrome c biogenesis protein CcdA [Solirubrobacterales bacterium]|nr:cytochrome c biogenesis protein CcdA [Solirubrobacterales bacterium]